MSKKTPFELRYDLLAMAMNMLNPTGDVWVKPDEVIALAHKLNAFVSDTEPTRKVFSVDVGNMKPDEAAAIIDTIKRGINKQVLFETPEEAIKNLKRSFELEAEDAVVVERIQAAPERDAFHIELPKTFYPPDNYLKLSPEELAENERLWREENPNKIRISDPAYNPLQVMEDYFVAQTGKDEQPATSPVAAVDQCIDKLEQAKAQLAESARGLVLDTGGCLGGKKDCNGGSDACTCGNDAGC